MEYRHSKYTFWRIFIHLVTHFNILGHLLVNYKWWNPLTKTMVVSPNIKNATQTSYSCGHWMDYSHSKYNFSRLLIHLATLFYTLGHLLLNYKWRNPPKKPMVVSPNIQKATQYYVFKWPKMDNSHSIYTFSWLLKPFRHSFYAFGHSF